MNNPARPSRGFTVVELAIVIVVIGILAAIVVVGFRGMQVRAGQISLDSDMGGGVEMLEVDRLRDGHYPVEESAAASNKGLSTSKGNHFVYTYVASTNSYCLTGFSDRQGVQPRMASGADGMVRDGTCPGHRHPADSTTATAGNCFNIQGNVLVSYYAYENNDSSQPACPRDVVIPTTVAVIGRQAFYATQITSVLIPSTVTTIEDEAFSNNPLTSVTLPLSVTHIGMFAFYNNTLTSIAIPDSVVELEYGAFARNAELTSATLPATLTTIVEGLFEDCALTSVTLPESVTRIEGAAFRSNELTSVVIPRDVRYIGGSAFSGNKLTSVALSSSLTEVGRMAFAYNQLASLTVPRSVTMLSSESFQHNSLTAANVPTGTTLEVVNSRGPFDAGVTVSRY